MRVLIVDDHPVAQTALANILSARSDVEHFESANDVMEVFEKMATDSYDVLLLDIDRDLSGSQLVDQLRERNLPLPSIVFATAHVEHAVAAFEKHTVDYVLKPFSNESINEALDRAAQRAKGERAAKMASDLQSLRTQLHAHFLFNALQGISTLTDSDPGRAKAMILKLSELLRAALRYGDSDLVALGEELKSIEHYLDLEGMRLGDRLQVRWNVQPETRRMLVPQLILQPLVENAIVHGIACCRGGGWIQITATRIEHIL